MPFSILHILAPPPIVTEDTNNPGRFGIRHFGDHQSRVAQSSQF